MKLNLKSLVLLAALASAFATSAQAALTLRFFTQVKGYSEAGWIEIVDGAPKAKPAKVNGKWITDRVERESPLLVKISGDGPCDLELVNATVSVKGKPVSTAMRLVPEEGSFKLQVIKNPSSDNVVVTVKSLLDNDRASRRVPIGTR
jgi:hypothetical protein